MKRPVTGKRPQKFYVICARVTPITATSGEVACRRVERANPKRGALLGRSMALRTPQDAELILGLVGGVPGRLYTVVTRRRRAKKTGRP